jgi:predicted PurR-regulated permease PerM
MENEQKLDISWESIFKISVAVVSLYIIYLVRSVLVWFIFAVIISVLLDPLFDFLKKKKVPRMISVLVVYTLIFGVLSLLIYLAVPLFVSEIRQFAQKFPGYFEKIAPSLKALGFKAFQDAENFIIFLSNNLESIAVNLFKAASAIFGGFLSTFFVISLAIFLSLEDKPIERTLMILFPKKYETYAIDLWKRCRDRVSGWFLSRVIGAVFVGFLTYLSLLIFKPEEGSTYPLILGFFAGILDFVPVIGPIFAGILIFILVSLNGLANGFFALIAFILIQQIENNIILPFLTKKFSDLSPVWVLLGLTVGGILWGVWGAILAVPLFGILSEFGRDFLKKRKEEAEVL